MSLTLDLLVSRCAAAGWTLDPLLTGPLLLLLAAYGLGTIRLWRRAGIGHGVSFGRGGCFLLGWSLLVLALVSPLHAAGRTVFTAHMIGHEILMAAAAPLLVLARPAPALLWALPHGWRRACARAAIAFRPLTVPVVATLLHGLAIWAWHVPALFEAALTGTAMHLLQHATFLGTALLFWWAMFGAGGRVGAVGHLFATAGHTGFLGLLLVLSPRLWFPLQGLDAAAWGLTPIEDQQLAGLVMWIPAGLVYAAAALAIVGRSIANSGPAGGDHVFRV